MQQKNFQQWSPDTKSDIQHNQVQQVLSSRWNGIQSYENKPELGINDAFQMLPTQLIGAVADQDTDIIKQFRFSYAKWFPKSNFFALGYNKPITNQKRQGYFSVFDINEWKLRYSKFSVEEAMVGLQTLPSQNKILGFGSNGGIYVISNMLEQRTEPTLQTRIELVTDVRLIKLYHHKSLCPSHNKMCFASSNKCLYIADPQVINELDELKGHGKDVISCHWNPIYNIILSGSEDETIRIWDPSKKDEMCTLQYKNITQYKKTTQSGRQKGQMEWVGAKDRFVNVFDLRKLDQEVHKINLQSVADALSWHPIYDNIFLTGDQQGTIQYWNINCPEEPIVRLSKQDTIIQDLDIDRTGQFLACIRSITNQKDQREVYRVHQIK